MGQREFTQNPAIPARILAGDGLDQLNRGARALVSPEYESLGGGPVDAAVGDGDAGFEGFPGGGEGLAAGLKVAFDHDADEGIGSVCDLIENRAMTSGCRSGFLPLFSWLQSTMIEGMRPARVSWASVDRIDSGS